MQLVGQRLHVARNRSRLAAYFDRQEKTLRILGKQLLALEDIVRETREEPNTTLVRAESMLACGERIKVP